MTLVVKAHTPWRTRLLFALSAVALVLGGYSLFEYGQFSAGFDRAASLGDQASLKRLNRKLEAQVAELREQKAVLERTSQIDHQSNADLQVTLKNLQDEILELKEELAFYRGIVSPRDATPGLRLQSFRLDPTGVARHYRYTVVLTQVLKNDTVTRGSVHLLIEGVQNGRQKELSLADVTEKAIKELTYQFKYFQNIDGELVLPANYVAQRVTVQVLPGGRVQDKIEETFDWPAEENLTHVGEQ